MYTDIYIDVVYALMFLLIDVFGGPEKGLLCWMASACLSLGLLGLLGEEDGLDVGQDTSLGDGNSTKEFVQFFVISDGQLQMTGNDTGLFVITGSVSSQLEDLSAEVFQDSSEVHWGTCSYTFRVVSISEKTMDSTDGELEPGTG